ncbi:hypothetical protein ABPG75_011282 [Micractinium tetrahymenae]
MPGTTSALMRTGATCFTPRRPARAGVQHSTRLARAAAVDPAAGSNVRIEAQPDGTVTYHFGEPAAEPAAALAAAAASGEPAAAAAGPQSAQLSAVLDAATAAAAAHAAVPVHAAAAAVGSSSGGGVAVLDPAPGIGAAFAPPAAVPLQDVLNGNGSSSSEEEHATSSSWRFNGSSNGSSARYVNGRRQQQQQQPPVAAAQRRLNGAVAAPLPRRGPPRLPQHQQQQQRYKPRVRSPTPLVDARSIDYQTAEAYTIVAAYEGLCDAAPAADLDEALHLIKECIRAGRSDVLSKLRHYRFLRPAASQRAVKQALRFVQLLPRQYVDARTYNMLLRVCARACDLRNALHVADMLQAAGLKMDSHLYTTLISACAGAGDADKAFQLYSEMKVAGVPSDKMVYASVVKACAQHISRLPPSERRQQLVLLERAFGLVQDARAARIPTDAAVWNALVTAAGRAGQLQRAFEVLEDMLGAGVRPNDRTYASLIDACARAGNKALALRVYRKAQREGCAAALEVYSAAVNACVQSAGGCDSEAAMSIYADMHRSGVEPDTQMYGQLMTAAGAAGNLDLALGLHEEMQRDGLRPCTGTQSALMSVYIRNGRLAEAQRIYREMRAAGDWPAPYALNALLNCYANSFRLGDVVSLVCNMAEGGLRPDSFTFAAIFNACQRADEAELALDVARLMKLRGVRMDEACAAMLLRICYNRLRQSWVPGGYPPHRPTGREGGAAGVGALPGSKRSHERQRLLEALAPRGQQAELREQGEVAWLSQAFAVYREAVSAGVKPTMRMLNRVLMCLRVAWEGKHGGEGTGGAVSAEALLPHHSPAQLGAFSPAVGVLGGDAGVARQERIGVESVYHVQAVSILEEAIISNVVPSFKIDSDEPIDLRSMPPAVAEVYVLTVLSAMQRLCEARRVITQNIVFLVPEYDGSKVFMPSHLSHIDYEQIAPAGPVIDSEEEGASEEEAYGLSFGASDAAFALASAGGGGPGDDSQPADERTGLGVAGVLRRLRLWAREYGERGFILLEAKEITRWCKATQRAVERRSASALPVQKPYGQPGRSSLVQQQHQIRSSGW